MQSTLISILLTWEKNLYLKINITKLMDQTIYVFKSLSTMGS